MRDPLIPNMMPRKNNLVCEQTNLPVQPSNCVFSTQEDADKFVSLFNADHLESVKEIDETFEIYPSSMWFDSFKERVSKYSPESMDRLNKGETLHAILPKNMAISNQVVEHIKENLPEGSTILEFGSGRGTEILSKTFNMLSVEEDLDWVDRYDSEYLHAEIKEDWYDIEKVNNFIKDKSYNLVLIDGPAHGDRNKIVELISNGKLKLNTNVSYLIDDVEREDGMKLLESIVKLLNREAEVGMYVDATNTQHAFAYFKEIEND